MTLKPGDRIQFQPPEQHNGYVHPEVPVGTQGTVISEAYGVPVIEWDNGKTTRLHGNIYVVIQPVSEVDGSCAFCDSNLHQEGLVLVDRTGGDVCPNRNATGANLPHRYNYAKRPPWDPAEKELSRLEKHDVRTL